MNLVNLCKVISVCALTKTGKLFYVQDVRVVLCTGCDSTFDGVYAGVDTLEPGLVWERYGTVVFFFFLSEREEFVRYMPSNGNRETVLGFLYKKTAFNSFWHKSVPLSGLTRF
jgi:hypothetical protein